MRFNRSLFLFLFALPATAAPFLVGSAYSGASGAATLYRISAATGTATAVGPIGFARVGSLDLGPDGKLYGAGANLAGAAVLLTINPNTGGGTVVGALGLAPGRAVQDIAFRPSDGKLFAMATGDLFTVDPSTGAATLVGDTGLGFADGNGLAFRGATLFTATQTGLYTVNTGTGAASLAVALSYPAAFGPNESRPPGMKFDAATGTLWTVVVNNGGGSGGLSSLGTIDVSTGAVTFVGATQAGMDGFAVTLFAPPAIPAVSDLTLVLLAVLLACCAVRRLGRVAAIVLVVACVLPAQTTRLRGTVSPRVKDAVDRGPVDPALPLNRVILMLGGDAETDRKVTTFIDTLHDRHSANYQQWLTPEEFGRKFGPAPEDVAQVTEWLQREGLRVGSVARSGRWLEFSGDAAHVESAFRTRLRQYEVRGETYFANDSEVSIPAALSRVVTGVSPLHDFRRRKPLPGPRLSRLAPRALVDGEHHLSPADFAKIYNLGPLYQAGITGAGVTIAIPSFGTMHPEDGVLFQQFFGLPVHAPTVIVNGTDPGPYGEIESVLDVEWSGAVAPGASIVLVATLGSDNGEVLSSAYIVDHNLGDVVSLSYGSCEDGPEGFSGFFNRLWQQAAAQGMSVMVSSGDDGAYICGHGYGLSVNGFASTPFNTAVGGTQLDERGNDPVYWTASGAARGYVPETAWNERLTVLADGHSGVTGGGASLLYPKPAWQNLNIPGMPNDGARDVPDVSLPAAFVHDAHLLCIWGNCQNNTIAGAPFPYGGGTSAAAPTFAGIMALIVQKTGRRQGLANYVLYSLAAHQNYANCDSSSMTNPSLVSNCVFQDITTGDNSVGAPGDPVQQGYKSGAGYDLTTGLGSVNAANLVNAWASEAAAFRATVTTLSSAQGSSISTVHGKSVPFTVQVSPAAGAGTPSGVVEFSATPDASGGSGVLSGGTFLGSIATLPAGSYSLSAVYRGDAAFGGSRSNPIPVTVAKEPSSVSLDVQPVGAGYQFHAFVSVPSGIGSPRGVVTLLDGGTALATQVTGSTGDSQFYVCANAVTLCVSGGRHSFTARYEGDINLAGGLSAPLIVNVSAPPVIVESFSPAVIPVNGSTLLTFTITNANPAGLDGVKFFDPLPGGLLVENPNGLVGTCGDGNIVAAPGTAVITLDSASLPAGAVCTISVRIRASTAGSKLNRLEPVNPFDQFPFAAFNPPDPRSVPAGESPTVATLTVVSPPGMALTAGGLLLVANVTGGRLDQYDSSGVVRSSFGSPGTATGQFDHPMGVAIAANQDIWVADSGNHRIQVFDRNGVFRFAFGGLGTGPGRFRNPAAIAIGANGAVCVADTGNDRVQCFDGADLSRTVGNNRVTPRPVPIAGGDCRRQQRQCVRGRQRQRPGRGLRPERRVPFPLWVDRRGCRPTPSALGDRLRVERRRAGGRQRQRARRALRSAGRLSRQLWRLRLANTGGARRRRRWDDRGVRHRRAPARTVRQRRRVSVRRQRRAPGLRGSELRLQSLRHPHGRRVVDGRPRFLLASGTGRLLRNLLGHPVGKLRRMERHPHSTRRGEHAECGGGSGRHAHFAARTVLPTRGTGHGGLLRRAASGSPRRPQSCPRCEPTGREVYGPIHGRLLYGVHAGRQRLVRSAFLPGGMGRSEHAIFQFGQLQRGLRQHTVVCLFVRSGPR